MEESASMFSYLTFGIVHSNGGEDNQGNPAGCVEILHLIFDET